MIENPVKRALREGGYAFGAMLFEFATVGIARILAAAGAELVIFDQEHTGWSIETLKPLIVSAGTSGVVPIVRVPTTQEYLISAALDAGAMGVMVPMVEDVDQARRIVNAAKYPSAGRRGFGLLYSDEFGGDAADTASAMTVRNREQLLIAIIETSTGASNAEEIASVAGIDLLWIGHQDLTNSLGIPGEVNHPLYQRAVDQILCAATAHNKPVGMMATTPAEGADLLSRGFRCVCYGDLWIYQQALKQALDSLHLSTRTP